MSSQELVDLMVTLLKESGTVICFVAVVYWLVKPVIEAGIQLLERKTRDPNVTKEIESRTLKSFLNNLESIDSRLGRVERKIEDIPNKVLNHQIPPYRPEEEAPPFIVENRRR